MNESFEVTIHPIQKRDTASNDATASSNTTGPCDPCERYRYKAQWVGRQYIADNIMCHISAVRPADNICHWQSWTGYESGAPYETTFKCHSRTLDACISEAEHVLKDCLFGKAELLDGKYRVATVTKRYDDDDYTCSNLTKYGQKCKKSEPAGKSVRMSIDEFDAYYDEY